jgi:hypothetical protein
LTAAASDPSSATAGKGMRRRRRRNADSVMEINHIELKGVREVDVVKVCEGVWKDDMRMA